MGRRNPNGYGSITKLKGNRLKPYCVRITVYDEDGLAKQKCIGCEETKEKAMILLAQFNNNPWDIDGKKVTLKELCDKWIESRLPRLAQNTQSSVKSKFRYISKYYHIPYRNLRAYHMQDTIDNCGHGYGTQQLIRTLWSNLDRYAFECDIIEKMYSQILVADQTPETSRRSFTKQDIDNLWKIQDKPFVNMVLIYLYTGFRRNELTDMKKDQVNLSDMVFVGGSKTKAGKNRVVPIHSRIQPLVLDLMKSDSEYLLTYTNGNKLNNASVHSIWTDVMNMIEVKYTIHEARHTFETMLDDAGANRKCIDMLMGHKSRDTGNRVYNHKTLDQLRETIELLH